MTDNTRLRIAMQKSGRLSDDSRELLARCGIKINLHTQRLIAMAENMPIDILRVRDDDIPGLVMDGVVDLGIIGENVLEEELLNRRAQGEDPRYFTLRRLDFGGCRLSLATPVDEAWDGPLSLNGKRIATSYPHLLKRYLDQKGISFKSCLLNGSVEVAPRAGLADAICDLVSTGATLEANGLREVEVIYRSKACLIQRDGEMEESKQQLIDKLLALVRVEKQQRLDHRERIALAPLLEQVAQDAAATLAARGVRLLVQADEASVAGDALLLRQALGNLLDNAAGFAPPGSCIDLTARRQGNQVEIAVRDRGAGIPAYAQERIFERFYSLPRPDAGKSTGLGLPFVREVASLHGGTAEVLNHEEGGACARLCLPLA